MRSESDVEHQANPLWSDQEQSIHTNPEEESLQLRSFVGQLLLILLQWVHEPRDQVCGKYGHVRLVEVLEIT